MHNINSDFHNTGFGVDKHTSGRLETNSFSKTDGLLQPAVSHLYALDHGRQGRTPAFLPYPLLALILAACGGGGGGGGGPVTNNAGTADTTKTAPKDAPAAGETAAPIRKSLAIYDPPVGGVPVYVDVNGNMAIDGDDLRLDGVTDSAGNIVVFIPSKYGTKMLLADLRDKTALEHVGTLNSDLWIAPAESNVISALTTLLVRAEVTAETIDKFLQKEAAQLRSFDPLKHNPYDQSVKTYDVDFVKAVFPHLERDLANFVATQPAQGGNPAGGGLVIVRQSEPVRDQLAELLKSAAARATKQKERQAAAEQAEQAEEQPEAIETGTGTPAPNPPMAAPNPPVAAPNPPVAVPNPPPTDPQTPTLATNKPPTIHGFSLFGVILREAAPGTQPQTLIQEVFIRDDDSTDLTITVERLNKHGEWTPDERFAARKIDSTERTDDYRLRTTKKGNGLDREDSDLFESQLDAKEGTITLRIKVEDGDGNTTTSRKSQFILVKGLAAEGGTLTFGVNKNQNTGLADFENTIFDTTTTFAVKSTYKYAVEPGIQPLFARHVTYQAVDPDKGKPGKLDTVQTVTNANAFTIDTPGTYLVSVTLNTHWTYTDRNGTHHTLTTVFLRKQDYQITIIDPQAVDPQASGSPAPSSYQPLGTLGTPSYDPDPFATLDDGFALSPEII